MFPTTGLGLLTTTATGSVTVGLQQLGNVDASDLNFAGTGATSQQDATASSYQVSVPSSVTTSAGNGTAVEFTGFVTPFGSAPPDFAASTLVVYGQTQTLFRGGDVRTLSARALEVLAAEIPYAEVPRAETFDTLELFLAVGIAPSKGAIRRLLEQGGLSVNGRKLPATDRAIPASEALPGGYFLLRKGARDYALARIAG